MVGVIGTGPAGLMAADVLSARGIGVCAFEKRKAPGRKLLVAGSSGLNITNALPLDEFVAHYKAPHELWDRLIQNYTPSQWIQFIEDLGFKTFLGTSGRYFLEEMKASGFLQTWIKRLQERGVEFRYDHELSDFKTLAKGVHQLSFANAKEYSFSAVCFAMGGGSWEPQENPLRWPQVFRDKGLKFHDFSPSNVGYQVAWSEEFLKKSEGLPLKRIVMKSPRAERAGDAMITKYGIEGTPVYFSGQTGEIEIDLKPDLSEEQIIERLNDVKENWSLIRRVQKKLNLCEAAQELLFHHTPSDIKEGSVSAMARWIKSFRLELGKPQSLDEAISSSGGLCFSELDQNLMLKRYPGFFAAGEMLDWDAPTGGFLIQGCVAQGHATGNAIASLI